jgi:hypothetical protein
LGAAVAFALAAGAFYITPSRQVRNDLCKDSHHQPLLIADLPKKSLSYKKSIKYQISGKNIDPFAASTRTLDSLAVRYSELESILEKANLSFEEQATRLLECTRREDLPMEVRLDALDHAFNLDRWQAMTLCMEKPLAKPIAERLLSGIHNHGEAPKDQVSACMHLVLHEDEEIRQQAQELLAFLVSAEEHASDPDKLREAADAFLKQTEEGDAEQGADADSE